MLKLPGMISDGCVLQQGKRVKIYGTDVPGGLVTARLGDCRGEGYADASGKWKIFLEGLQPGGPYELFVENEKGESVHLTQVYVGEVWLCSGQSNMELPMERVKDRYPEELTRPGNPFLRMYKIQEHYTFTGPLAEHVKGAWKQSGPENIREFSAAAYFFGKELAEIKKVPVGLIDASKGGSRIEAWMSREALADYPWLLQETEDLREERAVEEFTEHQEKTMREWLEKNGLLAGDELPAVQNTDGETYPGESCGKICVPGYLAQAGLPDFCGSILLRRSFTLPESMAGQEASLWLGTMVDSDRTYINGVQVGETGYQYPPRKYTVPAGLLRAGENEIEIRLVCNDGHGRLTPGKEYRLFTGTEGVELSGEWEYRVLRRCRKAPEMDFLCRKATGLYNAMIAPCLGFQVRGVFWYQGESNDRRPGDYEDLLKRMITSWRESWGEELPFIVAQLPDFSIDLAEENSGWPEIREAQGHAAALPRVAVTVNLDLGEDNDLHPLNKKGVAHRAVLAARAIAYGEEIPFRGPVLKEWAVAGDEVELSYEICGNGELKTLDGMAPGEFELAGSDRCFYRAEGRIEGSRVWLKSSRVKEPVAVRYAWSNAPGKGLLCDSYGLPAAPFRDCGVLLEA